MRIWLGGLTAFLVSTAVTAQMRTGDAYLDAETMIVATRRPAPEVLAAIDAGHVDVNRPLSEGMTLVHFAAVAGDPEVMKGLLARGGRLDLKRDNGDTALDLARKPALVAYLRASGRMPPAQAAVSTRAGTAVSPKPASPKPAARTPRTKRELECEQKQYADAALCSDSSCRMRTYSKWQQCLKTGRYW